MPILFRLGISRHPRLDLPRQRCAYFSGPAPLQRILLAACHMTPHMTSTVTTWQSVSNGIVKHMLIFPTTGYRNGWMWMMAQWKAA